MVQMLTLTCQDNLDHWSADKDIYQGPRTQSRAKTQAMRQALFKANALMGDFF